MPAKFNLAAALLLPLLGSSVLLSGCNVETHKNGGNNDDVNIGTPFGSLKVKTNDDSVVAALGLSPYPGATFVKKHGDDDGAADISMSFGSFKLGVHAADMQSSDPQDKILAFYRKDLSRYGTVIECHNGEPVGEPTRTSLGLSCNDQNHVHTNLQTSTDHDLELRAGSQTHQHIVGVNSANGGTRIGLVALDLPKSTKSHDSEDRE